MRRASSVAAHLAPATESEPEIGSRTTSSTTITTSANSNATDSVDPRMILIECFQTSLGSIGDKLPSAMLDRKDAINEQILFGIGGPLDKMSECDALNQAEARRQNGDDVVLMQEWAREYGSAITANISEPTPTVLKDTEDISTSPLALKAGFATAGNFVRPALHFGRRAPKTKLLVVINDPADAWRIARQNVQKSVFYQGGLIQNGVLATYDTDQWRQQREELTSAFLPNTSLRAAFPKTAARARWSIETKLRRELAELAEHTRCGFNINEFFLFETMAQLQLTLLCETEEFMEATNAPLRRAFFTVVSGIGLNSIDEFFAATQYVRANSIELHRRAEYRRKQQLSTDQTPTARSSAAGSSTAAGAAAANHASATLGCPIRTGSLADHLAAHTPVSTLVRSSHALIDTWSTFTFAGHDTTGNMMTWLVFELARHPHLQARLWKEVDALALQLGDRDLEYDDLFDLPFLSACIRETLRLWPSVPNGTFRELVVAEEVTGRGGRRVLLPVGTQVQLPTWCLHRNPKLWGEDVLEFNPDRPWLPEECWDGSAFAGERTASHRYCPFTYAPRDCMGRNFAHMESRAILFYLIKHFSMQLADETLAVVAERERLNIHPIHPICNQGTNAPLNGMFIRLTARGGSATP